MRRLIKKIVPCFQKISAEINGFNKPRFERHDKARTIDLTVFVPGVDTSGIELVVDEGDLIVTARKAVPVRPNFPAACFEAVQHDYQLRLTLDDSVDVGSIRAAFKNGILTIHLRKPAHRVSQLLVA